MPSNVAAPILSIHSVIESGGRFNWSADGTATVSFGAGATSGFAVVGCDVGLLVPAAKRRRCCDRRLALLAATSVRPTTAAAIAII